MKEAMKLAIEALKNTTPTGFNMESDKKFFAAIKALEEALAKQEQGEKRKLLPRCFADYQPNHTHDRKCEWCAVNTECQTGEQTKQEQGEPDNEVLGFNGWGFPIEHPPKSTPAPATKEQIREAIVFNLPLYTTPQQRKPLTFYQVEDCFPERPSVFVDAYGDHQTSPRWLHDFARAIESAHGIKELK